MLSLLKLPIVIVCNDFVVSGLAASPGAGLCCASEDSRAITNLFEVVNEPACFVLLIGMIEQEIFHLLKVACLADVENHNLFTSPVKLCYYFIVHIGAINILIKTRTACTISITMLITVNRVK